MLWICCELYSKSTTSPQQIELVEFRFRQVVDLWHCSQSQWAVYHVTTTSLYVIAKMDAIDENVNNKQFCNCQLHRSLMRTTMSRHCRTAIWMPLRRRNLHGLGCCPHSILLQVWNIWCMLLSLSLFNGYFPGEPVLAGVYWSRGWWRWWWQMKSLLVFGRYRYRVSGIGRYQRVSVSADTPIILARDTDTGEQQCVWPST